MRRVSTVVLSLVALIGGAVATAPTASADFKVCEVVGNVAPPAEDDCWGTTGFIGDTWDRQADNVFFVFCEAFPGHEACQA